MLTLVNIEYGGYHDNTQYVVYDSVKNELNSYTEGQVLKILKKGIEIYGIEVDTRFCINNIQSTYYNIKDTIQLVDNKRLEWTYGLAHTNAQSRFLLLHRPVYLNKLKDNMTFIYKSLKIIFHKKRTKDDSYFSIILNEDMTGGSAAKDLFMDVYLNDFMHALEEIIPYLSHNIEIKFYKFASIKHLDLSSITQFSNNKNIAIQLTLLHNNSNTIETINLGRGNLKNLDLSWFTYTGFTKKNSEQNKNLVSFIDLSDCYNDYDKVLNNYYDRDAKFLRLDKDLSGIILLFNENTPNYIKTVAEANKLVYLGKVHKERKFIEIPSLLAKRNLINKQLKESDNCFVLVV